MSETRTKCPGITAAGEVCGRTGSIIERSWAWCRVHAPSRRAKELVSYRKRAEAAEAQIDEHKRAAAYAKGQATMRANELARSDRRLGADLEAEYKQAVARVDAKYRDQCRRYEDQIERMRVEIARLREEDT